MTNEKDLQGQIDVLKARLDAFNSAPTIPYIVDKAWVNRGFVKHDFFVAGTSALNVIGSSYIVIPGSDKNSIALITPFSDAVGTMAGNMQQGYANGNFGASSTQFDITNPAGDTFRYTYDGTGTDPNINATTLPVGARVYVFGDNFNSANNNATTRPFFIVTGSGANYFEVNNPTPGVAENNKTLGATGSITGGGPVDSPYELHVEGTANDEFSFVVFLFDYDDLLTTI